MKTPGSPEFQRSSDASREADAAGRLWEVSTDLTGVHDGVNGDVRDDTVRQRPDEGSRNPSP